jgi:hypothetical protein
MSRLWCLLRRVGPSQRPCAGRARPVPCTSHQSPPRS